MNRYTYDYVMGGITFKHFQNFECRNAVKVLFISDSFGVAVAPYLIMAFKQFQGVSIYNLEIVTKNFIESYSPDVVVFLTYPVILASMKTLYEYFQ